MVKCHSTLGGAPSGSTSKLLVTETAEAEPRMKTLLPTGKLGTLQSSTNSFQLRKMTLF